MVYDSIIGLMNDYETMAALLAHEYSHIERRHTIKMLVRGIASYALVSLLFGDVSGLSAALLDNASALNNLQYQRGMVRLLEQLQKQGDSPKVFAWFSTHPDIDKRIAYTKEYIARSTYTPKPDDSLKLLWIRLRKRDTPALPNPAHDRIPKRSVK